MKVLIWNNFPLQNIGGPSGYCYNIHTYLEEHPTAQITFLTDLVSSETGSECKITCPNLPSYKENVPSKLRSLIQRVPIYLKFWYPCTCLLRRIKELKFNVRIIIEDFNRNFYKGINSIPSSINLNDYDFIHFHMVQTLMQFKTEHPEYRGKTIITSHCPSSWTDERLNAHEYYAKYFRWLGIRNECKVFETSDYIMFPCREAREPYEKVKAIKKVFKNNEDKFFYVPTAIIDTDKKLYKQEISEFGIPKDSFVITFFGRHNCVKGYDILKQVGERLLPKYPRLYFLCAGNGNIQPLQHKRWIELGFINNAQELHAQSDLYILPNRDTYFDIGTLEVLRAGIHIIMSSTGGNRFFNKLPSNFTCAIKFFNIGDLDTLIENVEDLLKLKQEHPLIYKKEANCNRDLYLKYFTPKKYVETYLNEIEKLYQ